MVWRTVAAVGRRSRRLGRGCVGTCGPGGSFGSRLWEGSTVDGSSVGASPSPMARWWHQERPAVHDFGCAPGLG